MHPKVRNMTIRLNKFISSSGYCSRREADKFIENGNVTINGKVAKVGDQVTTKDTVKVNGHKIESQAEPVYLALNKPTGITCTTDPNDRTNIVDFVNYPERIFNIGRLDKDSEGLILLTNNGDIVNKILRAGNNHDKEYVVTVDKPITTEFIEKMQRGVPILGTVTKKCVVQKEAKNRFRIVLTQGLNRQIRRMCEALGYEVSKLKRVRIMNISLDGLATGQWRTLTKNELSTLLESIKESDGEESASKGAGAGSTHKATGNKGKSAKSGGQRGGKQHKPTAKSPVGNPKSRENRGGKTASNRNYKRK